MNYLIPFLAIASPTSDNLLDLLFKVAIAVVIIGAILALVKWAGWTIPQPVWIVGGALVAILLIILLFRLFGLLV